MNRLGIAPSEIPAFARALADCPHLRLEGTFTHLASSEVFTTDQSVEQEKTFEAALGLHALAGTRSRHRAHGQQRGDCQPPIHMARHGAARRHSVWLSPVLRAVRAQPGDGRETSCAPRALVSRPNYFHSRSSRWRPSGLQRPLDRPRAVPRRCARRGLRRRAGPRAFEQRPSDRSRPVGARSSAQFRWTSPPPT